MSNVIVRLCHKDKAYISEEILHQSGDYGIARGSISEPDAAAGLTIGNTEFRERNMTILAIERGKKVLSLPKDEEAVLAGDYLLCYGKVSDFTDFL